MSTFQDSNFTLTFLDSQDSPITGYTFLSVSNTSLPQTFALSSSAFTGLSKLNFEMSMSIQNASTPYATCNVNTKVCALNFAANCEDFRVGGRSAQQTT